MAIISQTITNLGPVAKRGTVSRGEYVASREDWEDHLTQVTVGEINTWSTQANVVRNEMNAFANVIVQIKDDSESIKEDIDTQKTQIDNKYTEIMGYTIPTEATYNETTIDAKVRMSQVLSLTNSI
jgi:hypothetical protein